MKKLFTYLWNDKPSMWLWFIFLVAAIGYAKTDLTITALLGMAVLNIMFMVLGRGKFIDSVIKYCNENDEEDLLIELNIKTGGKRIYDRSIFETIVLVILLLGGIFMAGAIVYTFIFQG